MLHNDDTTMKILELTREQRAAALGEDAAEERTGVFTSGIVAVGQGGRSRCSSPAYGMPERISPRSSSALAQSFLRRSRCATAWRNLTRSFETLLVPTALRMRARRYVEVAESFPEEVRFVLETLREVYQDRCASARKQGLSPEAAPAIAPGGERAADDRLARVDAGAICRARVEPNSRSRARRSSTCKSAGKR